MNAQQLKNSILQRAIEGKLIPQRTEEGNAADLLREIKAEKARLVKDGKIKKEKPLPEIVAEEIPFEIPESWVWVRLGEIGDWSAGTTPSRQNPEYYNGTVPWLKTGDLNDSYITYIPENITQEAINNTSVRLNPVGSVLMAMYGATIGKLGILSIPATTNQACCACIPFNGIYNKYLFHFLMCERRNFIKLGAGGAQPNISRAKIVNYLVPLPPLAEQKRIVAKIEELLPHIEQYGNAYDELTALNEKFPDAMKKSVLQYAMEGKLVEQRAEEGTAKELLTDIVAEKARLVKEGKIKKEKPLPKIVAEEIPFEIPESWEWVRWGDVSQSIQYGYNAPAKTSGRIKMVRISDIHNNKILWDTVPYCDISESDIETYRLEKDDILFARTGGTVGKSYLVTDAPEEAIFAGYLIRTRYSRLLIPQYLKYFMESQLYWMQLRSGTIATAQPNCNGKTLSKMLLPLPPLAEQKRIVAKIEGLLACFKQLGKA